MVENENEEKTQEKESSAPKPVESKKVKMVAVRLVAKDKGTALVEFEEKKMLKRVYVPLAVVDKGKVAEDDLASGVDYGVDWSTAKIEQIDPSELDAKLKAKGIWTLDDFNQNQMQVNRVIFSLANATKAELLRVAKESKEN